MKLFAGRLFAALFVILPIFAGMPALADSGSDQKEGGSSSTEQHHEDSDNGNNDDGASDDDRGGSGSNASGGLQGGSTGGSVFSGSDSSKGQDAKKFRRRLAAYVAAPVLDTQQTKDAIESGKAASMPLLTTYLNNNYPGQILDVKLHDAADGYVYEVRYLSNIIVLRTVFLDAATLKAK